VKTPNVLWQPNSDVQRAFLACSARTAMIGGGAGSGKTSALLAAAALQSGNPKHRGVLFRRDYPSLKHIISASYALFMPMRATYNKSDHTWTFPSGATIEFSHLEDETAVFQHAGKEYSFIGFDELTQLPGDSVDSRGQPINSAFSFMQSRLRSAADSGLV
jgi:Terminase large subunit, T4likevirus-type, N-terminal